jgi:hypothetical protein
MSKTRQISRIDLPGGHNTHFAYRLNTEDRRLERIDEPGKVWVARYRFYGIGGTNFGIHRTAGFLRTYENGQ